MTDPNRSKEAIVGKLKSILANRLYYEESEVTPELLFSEMGVDSVMLAQICKDINKEYVTQITVSDIVGDYNVEKLSALIMSRMNI